jgi:fluoride exporter
MKNFLLICIAGGVGTGARYLLSAWVLATLGPSFPWGTLSVNVLGSFVLAVVMFAGVEAAAIPPALRLVLGTGLMGGFTTYSTFSFETMRYLQDGAWFLAAAYAATTLVACLASCFAGWAAARWLLGS